MFGLLALALVSEAILIGSLMTRGGNSFLAAVVGSEVVSLTNTERSNNSVGALVENALLDKSAQAKANDMAAKGYFAHVTPDGLQPWAFIEQAGYDYQYAGENLAVRFVDSKDVVNAWMSSPTHRANIVKAQYTEIGVGIADGMYKGMPATFVVQHFAKPSSQALLSRAKGAVLGASVVSQSSFSNTATRQIGKLVSEPRSTTAFILGGIILLLMLVMGVTAVNHVQIQPRDMLLPATVVAGMALAMLLLNGSGLSFNAESSNQAASVVSAGADNSSGMVVVGEEGAFIER